MLKALMLTIVKIYPTDTHDNFMAWHWVVFQVFFIKLHMPGLNNIKENGGL